MLLYNPQVKFADRKVKNGNGHRRRHQIRNGQRMAALRAYTAAMLYRDQANPNLAVAAASCGSNVVYVQAMLIVTASENTFLLERVLKGEVSVLAAAHAMKRIAQFVSTFRGMTAAERTACGRIVGPGTVFDTLVVPAL